MIKLRQGCALLLSVALALGSGCSSNPGRDAKDALIIGGAGAGGAALAYELSDGDPLWTAAGAGAGALTGLAITAAQRNAEQTAFDAGYDRGLSDAAKRNYWQWQNMQKSTGDKEAEPEIRYYEFTGEEVTPDGRRLRPHTVIVPVVE